MSERSGITREENWARLMTLAQAGDSKAYEKLLRELSLYIKGIVRKRLDDPSRCDDVNQDILLALHKARHNFDSSRPFLPWLHAIIRFRLTDHLRKIYAGKRFEELDLDSSYGETFCEPQTNDEVDGPLLQALESLPEKQRLAVKLLKLDGLSVKEAAQSLGVSESALKVNAHRAYKAMKIFLTGKGGEHA